ncbi:MAG: HD domain-containing phosphohydrolase [Acidobacteriota bacterium]
MFWIKRPKILHHVLLVLMLVSICPLSFYGWQLIQINREKLETSEKLSQLIIAKSLAGKISLYISSYRDQVRGFASAVELTGGLLGMDQSNGNLLLRKKLQEFVTRSRNLLYINIVNTEGKGVRAGSYSEPDSMVQRFLTTAFQEASKDQLYISEPLAIDVGNQVQPVIIMSTPLHASGRLIGVTTVVLGLDELLHWVSEDSVAGKTVFVVDFTGRIVVHPDRKRVLTGMDFASSDIVHDFTDAWQASRGNVRVPGTRPFTLLDGNEEKSMLGTYYPIPETLWAVIVQIDSRDAFATVTKMKEETVKWGSLMLLLALLVGSISARSITTPVRQLAEGARAISRGDFAPIQIKSQTEIGELAETFNKMTDDLKKHIEEIRRAGRQHKELFDGTIRALAAAIDEKDPYTRGHSDRVTSYSLAIARHMGIDPISIDYLRISAQLHDVGKIGIEDRVLKKPGALTAEEFELMKQHTVKGANIMKPIEQMREMIPGMKHHHERWDGDGYPDRLRGEEIHLFARIISVADTFDAMTTNRPYQQAFDLEATVTKIRDNAGIRYDPRVVAAFLKAVECGDIQLSSTPDRALAV